MFLAPMASHSLTSDIRARFPLTLDPEFTPISLVLKQVRKSITDGTPAVKLTFSLERLPGDRSVHQFTVPDPKNDESGEIKRLVERVCKFLLWQQGASRVGIHSSDDSDILVKYLAEIYSASGPRAFDANMMKRAFGLPLVFESLDLCEIKATDTAKAIGGHLDGCRIGFDLGASDYKLAAVQNGEPVYTTEIPWDPRVEADPDWHRNKINEGLKQAAEKLPRVDAIGGSSAGIIINSEPRVASLFRSVPDTLFTKKVRPIFHNLAEEWNVPFEVSNDGDVTALAGAMSLKTNGVLGLAMGSSQAVGFLDQKGRITGWLNELAFAPIDFHPSGPTDEWSGDKGCGVQYFSQQGVVRLAKLAGIELPDAHPAIQLKHIQKMNEAGDPNVPLIFDDIGICLGYALGLYGEFYNFNHLLALGRVTSGRGGEQIINKATEVLNEEFPELATKVKLQLPDEKSKRVGQAVAAASLPKLNT
tara:strand:+ start:75 stop:1499 length:1425 start_codon:yes stop_codon:yes gene_type:complete